MAILACVSLMTIASTASATKTQPIQLEQEVHLNDQGEIQYRVHLTYDPERVLANAQGAEATIRIAADGAGQIVPTTDKVTLSGDRNYVATPWIPVNRKTTGLVRGGVSIGVAADGERRFGGVVAIRIEIATDAVSVLSWAEYKARYASGPTFTNADGADEDLEPGDVPGVGIKGPHEAAERCGDEEVCR